MEETKIESSTTTCYTNIQGPVCLADTFQMLKKNETVDSNSDGTTGFIQFF